MKNEKELPTDLDGTVSEIATIMAKGWLRLSAIRRVSELDNQISTPRISDPLSEKSLDFSGPRSLPAKALTPGERRRKGGRN